MDAELTRAVSETVELRGPLLIEWLSSLVTTSFKSSNGASAGGLLRGCRNNHRAFT